MKEFRAAIIRMHDNGVGNREIGRLLSISEATVRKAIIRYQETGGHGDRLGRGRKKTARSKKNIQRVKGLYDFLQTNFRISNFRKRIFAHSA